MDPTAVPALLTFGVAACLVLIAIFDRWWPPLITLVVALNLIDLLLRSVGVSESMTAVVTSATVLFTAFFFFRKRGRLNITLGIVLVIAATPTALGLLFNYFGLPAVGKVVSSVGDGIMAALTFASHVLRAIMHLS